MHSGDMDPDFSIIIPAHDSGGTLCWCLEGVAGQEYAGEYEVLVVESGEGGYLAEAAARFPRVRFIHAPFRLFSGQARNVGARHARGGTLAFLDADCRPVQGWLTALAAGHAAGFAAVSGAIGNANPESRVGTAEYLVSHSSYSPGIPAHELEGTTAASGNMSISRRLFEECGGFPGTARAVDFTLSSLLHGRGVRILFSPDAAVLHLNPSRTRDYFLGQYERGYWNGRTRIGLGREGSVAGRVPPLSFALFFLRAYRMIDRCFRYRILTLSELGRALPLCLLGIAAWTWGFFRASLGTGETMECEPLPPGWEGFEIVGPGD